MAIQEVMRLKQRRTVVKLPDSDTLFRLKTPTVLPSRIRWEELNQIKAMLSKQSGVPIAQLKREHTARPALPVHHSRQQAPARDPYSFWRPEPSQTAEIAQI